MPKIDVCVEPMFEGKMLSEKAKMVKDAGFDAIEFWFYDMDEYHDVDKLASFIRESGMVVNDIVVNAPDGSIGGSLVNPADRPKYLARLKESIKVANDLGVKKMITCSGNALPGIQPLIQYRSIVDTLKAAAEIAEPAGVTLCLEVLNSTVDHFGYFVDSTSTGSAVVREVNSPSVKLLYDVYHMQIMEGNVIDTIRRNVDIIGHFHSAGVPGRHELDNGELHYPGILKAVDETGYSDYFGLEYWPVLPEDESLRRMRELTR